MENKMKIQVETQLFTLAPEEIFGLKIKYNRINDVPSCILLTLDGYIDTFNSMAFEKRIHEITEIGAINFIFQCSNLTYLSSTGIGSFLSAQKTINHVGGDLVLLDMQKKVYDVLEVLGFLRFFNIRSNVKEAIKYFLVGDEEVKVSTFPKVVPCPICVKKLTVTKHGRFICPGCKSILVVDEGAQVFIG
jgi:anti-anti-sigma factor